MTTVLVSVLGYLGGDLLGLALARFGLAGFGGAATRAAAKSAPALVKAALDRLVKRADRDLPDAELAEHQSDRDIVRAASKDWFR